MNNEQFRQLVLQAQSGKPPENRDATKSPSRYDKQGFLYVDVQSPNPAIRSLTGEQSRHNAKGSKRDTKSSLPFNAVPRQVKFKSSAPKGVKLASGYVDRSKSRKDEDSDDKAKRIKALEEQVKLGQLDKETFEKLRDEIVGGDIANTHLVKGLDRKLLERVRKGENVYESKPQADESDENGVKDVDEELEELERREVKREVREKREKEEEVAQVAGVKRTRDQILAELKASRRAAKAPILDSRFKSIGEKKEEIRFEWDEKGREVMIIKAPDGTIKRKVRKPLANDHLPKPNKKAQALGADVFVPDQPKEESDDDIFEGIGTNYDPLGDLGEEDSSSSSEDEKEQKKPEKPAPQQLPPEPRSQSISPPPSGSSSPLSQHELATAAQPAPALSLPRNYFNDDPSTLSVLSNIRNPEEDAKAIKALASKARSINTENGTKGKSKATSSHTDKDLADLESDDEEEARLRHKAAELEAQDRDDVDLDMGFGTSRFEDWDEEEGSAGGTKKRVKLSEWGEEEGKWTGRSGQNQRKRGKKKKRGDKNSAQDVMREIERQRSR